MEASKNDRLVKKFAALEDKTWFPQELLELVKDVCRLQSEVRASLAVSVDPALVCGDMEHRQGAPLLAREQFPVDAEGAEKLFRAILEVAESLPQLRTTAQLVRDKLIRGDIRPEELFRAYMLENADPFEAWAKEAPDAPNLLPFLVYNSMEPWLEAAGEALSSAYPQNDVWQHGHCPVCGSPAFIGHLRLPITVTLQSLTKELLVRILKEPRNAILKQYEKLLELDEVKLVFEDEALEWIAEQAMKKETGARALRSIIEDFMLDIMYEIPKDPEIGSVVITRAYLDKNGGPLIRMRGYH